MAWKRTVLRTIPVLSRLANNLDGLEDNNRRLIIECQRLTDEYGRLYSVLQQVLFDESALLEADGKESAIDPLPIPPAALRYLVAGTENLPWFLEAGKLGAKTVVDVLAKQGKPLHQFKNILDFGCGCGRVLRHLKDSAGAALHGADPNALAIRWCQKHLGFAKFRHSTLEPPLPYSDGTFDVIYAFSIFTHLTPELQMRWIGELRRVLVAGGYLIITVHGDKTMDRLSPSQRAEYLKGNLVMLKPDVVGTNYCNAYHPERYVRSILARDFEVVDFIPEGARGNPPQDLYLLKS